MIRCPIILNPLPSLSPSPLNFASPPVHILINLSKPSTQLITSFLKHSPLWLLECSLVLENLPVSTPQPPLLLPLHLRDVCRLPSQCTSQYVVFSFSFKRGLFWITLIGSLWDTSRTSVAMWALEWVGSMWRVCCSPFKGVFAR